MSIYLLVAFDEGWCRGRQTDRQTQGGKRERETDRNDRQIKTDTQIRRGGKVKESERNRWGKDGEDKNPTLSRSVPKYNIGIKTTPFAFFAYAKKTFFTILNNQSADKAGQVLSF